MKTKENFRRIDIKRKIYTRGKANGNNNFKRYKKRVPKFIWDNPENKIAREKEKEMNSDVFDFTDSEPEDDLGMGLEISDLPFLCEQDSAEKDKDLFALTQDSVRPLFSSEDNYDPLKVNLALEEMYYSSFRPNQELAIKRILLGQSTLFVSPTGSGKSLCYQLPALLYWRERKYMTIVVSPLISLMEDQMSNFPSGLRAVSLHSGHTKSQRQNSINLLIKGDAQVVFISPEALVGGILAIEDLKNLPPVGFVCIDEAHCLCEWSHNFRPAYLQFFHILHDQLCIKTYLGLTATSTRSTSLVIADHLNIEPQTGIVGSTAIPYNLMLSITTSSSKEHAIIDILKSPTFRKLSSIIIYCNRRQDVDNLACAIRAKMQRYSTIIEAPSGSYRNNKRSLDSEVDVQSSSTEPKEFVRLTWEAEPYHAGISTDKRKKIQKAFIRGEIRVIVATIAFGMGINKSNVNAVIHYDMPSSFESYVQEIGRAGRDGATAQCHMLLSEDLSDLYYQQRRIYANVTEDSNLKKLVELMFDNPYCPCKTFAIELDQDEQESLEKQNAEDPHFLETFHFSRHNSDKENGSPIHNEPTNKNLKISIVKKHRICPGHERAFSIEDTVRALNLNPEQIITLICRLAKTYPQLKIDLKTPIRQFCQIACRGGHKQMQTLVKKFPEINCGFREHCKNYAGNANNIDKIIFDLVAVSRHTGKPIKDLMKKLKQAEWELSEETGAYKRSQVNVSFKGHSFHLKLITDLNIEERNEIIKYLKDYTTNYIKEERQKLSNVFQLFKQHSIPIEDMGHKETRLNSSDQLKASLNKYFETTDPNDCSIFNFSSSNQDALPPKVKETNYNIEEDLIRRRIKSFISAHGSEHSSRNIARVLQGVSTPLYPAEVWGTINKWWRTILNVDFERLSFLIDHELLKARQLPQKNKTSSDDVAMQ